MQSRSIREASLWLTDKINKLRTHDFRSVCGHLWRNIFPGRNPRLHPWLIDPEYLHLSSLKKAIKRFAPTCTGIVVDYGCGCKPYQSLFNHATRYIGIDFGIQGPDTFEPNPDGSIPLDADSADVMISTQVLEHIPNVQQYLNECVRVLRPNGRLLVSTHGIWPYHPGPHNDDFYRWTGAGLRREIELAGLKVVAMHEECRGSLCLAQQFLALFDPASARNRLFRLMLGVVSLMINSVMVSLAWIAPRLMTAGDIVPICILVEARKEAI